MIVSAALILLLAAAAAGVAGAARWLSRSIPRPHLVLFFAIAVLPFPRAFLLDRTPLPLDHVANTVPWMVPDATPPYNPNLNDVATQILPWTRAALLAWREGALPLRDRWNGCGMALASNSVSAAFSPLTFPALFLPLARAFTLIASLKLLLAAAGSWLFAREIGASARAAAFAAVAFALSFSFTPPWLFFPQSAVLCLWPWVLFLIERCRDESGRRRAAAALCAVFALCELAGHPETATMGFLFAALWLAARWTAGDLPRPGKLFAAIALAAAVAVLLTAFLLIPSVHSIAASGRIAAMAKPYWEPILSLAPHGPQWRALTTSFFPHTLGNSYASPLLPLGGASFPETGLGYFGIVGWMAVLLILRPGSPRRRIEWVLLGLLLCGLGVSVGQWPFAEIFSRTPVIGYLFPIRFHSWEALAGAALAALELDRYAKDLAERGRAFAAGMAIPLLLGAAAILVFRTFCAEHAASGGLLYQSRQLTITLSVLALAALTVYAARRSPRLTLAGLTVLCGAELLCQWRSISRPLYSPGRLFPETPLVRFLRDQPGPFRVVGQGPALFPSTNVFAGVEDIRTHDAVERRDYVAFLDATCGYPPLDYFKLVRDLDAPALDLMNVGYAIAAPGAAAPGERWRLAYAGEDGRVFANRRVLPRAFTPRRVRKVAAAGRMSEPITNANAAFGDAFRELVANPDWSETAWVLADRDEELVNGLAEISDYRESTNAASFSARVGQATAYVVVSLVQDGGWSARDATRAPVTILRANGPFLAVALPPGEHRVHLRYSPPGFAMGVSISLATAALLAVLAAAAALRRRRAGRATP